MLVAGAGQLRRALACLTAMSAGATERSQLSSLPCWRRAAAEHVPLATSPCAPSFSLCNFSGIVTAACFMYGVDRRSCHNCQVYWSKDTCSSVIYAHALPEKDSRGHLWNAMQ